MLGVTRLTNGLTIRRRPKKTNLLNEKRIKACLPRFDSGPYTRFQFLKAVCHSLGAHTDSLQPPSDTSSDSEYVILITSYMPRVLRFIYGT